MATTIDFFDTYVLLAITEEIVPQPSFFKDRYFPTGANDIFAADKVLTEYRKGDRKMAAFVSPRAGDIPMDTCNIWLNGLVGAGYLLGARAEFKDGENAETDLMAGIVKIHIYMTPPSPAQEIDFVLEYDADYVTSALQS